MSPAPNPVPFNRAKVAGRELELVREALENGHTSSGGRPPRHQGAGPAFDDFTQPPSTTDIH